MWAIAKIKKKEIKIFKEDLIKEVGKEVKFYCPKIEYIRYSGDKAKRFEKSPKKIVVKIMTLIFLLKGVMAIIKH